MTFRNNPNISNNQTSGLHISNAINNGDLVVTGRALTGSQPMDVAIVDGSGSQITTFGGMVAQAYDYIAYTSGANTDTYVFKSGGASGTLIATVTITYTDNTKAVLSTVART